mmetsp:Transcript_29177/g.31815  ORF Transcript_29177/g.31815 Transcript_29177/m.31815 type:complete len:201 (-) Transcript_29177:2417-3019(-)
MSVRTPNRSPLRSLALRISVSRSIQTRRMSAEGKTLERKGKKVTVRSMRRKMDSSLTETILTSRAMTTSMLMRTTMTCSTVTKKLRSLSDPRKRPLGVTALTSTMTMPSKIPESRRKPRKFSGRENRRIKGKSRKNDVLVAFLPTTTTMKRKEMMMTSRTSTRTRMTMRRRGTMWCGMEMGTMTSMTTISKASRIRIAVI